MQKQPKINKKLINVNDFILFSISLIKKDNYYSKYSSKVTSDFDSIMFHTFHINSILFIIFMVWIKWNTIRYSEWHILIV